MSIGRNPIASMPIAAPGDAGQLVKMPPRKRIVIVISDPVAAPEPR